MRHLQSSYTAVSGGQMDLFGDLQVRRLFRLKGTVNFDGPEGLAVPEQATLPLGIPSFRTFRTACVKGLEGRQFSPVFKSPAAFCTEHLHYYVVQYAKMLTSFMQRLEHLRQPLLVERHPLYRHHPTRSMARPQRHDLDRVPVSRRRGRGPQTHPYRQRDADHLPRTRGISIRKRCQSHRRCNVSYE